MHLLRVAARAFSAGIVIGGVAALVGVGIGLHGRREVLVVMVAVAAPGVLGVLAAIATDPQIEGAPSASMAYWSGRPGPRAFFRLPDSLSATTAEGQTRMRQDDVLYASGVALLVLAGVVACLGWLAGAAPG